MHILFIGAFNTHYNFMRAITHSLTHSRVTVLSRSRTMEILQNAEMSPSKPKVYDSTTDITMRYVCIRDIHAPEPD